jgi:hypothetical protein
VPFNLNYILRSKRKKGVIWKLKRDSNKLINIHYSAEGSLPVNVKA